MQRTMKSEERQVVFVGIDLHKRTWYVTVVDEDSEILFRSGIAADPNCLFKLLERYRGCCIEVVYEAGYFGYWLRDMLEARGIRCIVTPPSLIMSEYGNRVKTDKRDSNKLALLLSKGMLKAVTVPSPVERYHRQVIRTRHQMIGKRTQSQNQIRSLLVMYGIPLPHNMGAWSKAFVDHLHRLTLQDSYFNASYKILLEAYDTADRLVEKQTALLKQLSKEDKYRDSVTILTSIPGIGVISAMELLLELQDVRRFSRGDQLAAYVGLTPSQHSSGQHVRMGHITRVGKPLLRGLLIEAAWVLVRKDEEWYKKYTELVYRCGAKRAIVAIARRLILMSRRLLLDKRPYESRTAA